MIRSNIFGTTINCGKNAIKPPSKLDILKDNKLQKELYNSNIFHLPPKDTYFKNIVINFDKVGKALTAAGENPSFNFYTQYIFVFPIRTLYLFEYHAAGMNELYAIKNAEYFARIQLRVASVWLQEVKAARKAYEFCPVSDTLCLSCCPKLTLTTAGDDDDNEGTVSYLFEKEPLVAEPSRTPDDLD